MNIWTEIDRREIDGYTIKVCKTWEEISIRQDGCYGESEEYINQIEARIDSGELEWFMLRVQATKRDYVLGESYNGGFLYEDAMEILTDGIIEEMAEAAIMDAVVESKILKELL